MPMQQRGRQRQRGIAAIFAALSLVALISALALGVDTGRLYAAQRDLQRLADLAAIDAARVASGCFAGAGSRAQAPIEAAESLARNGKPGDATALTRIGRRMTRGSTLGFEPVAEGAPWDSIQVQLTRPSPARILPLFSGEDTRTLRAQAAAFSGVTISHGPASSLPDVSNPALLGQTLGPQLGGAGTSLVLDPSGLSGSADSRIRVGDLIDEEVSGGVDGSELDREETARGLLYRLVQLLRDNGDTATAALVQAYADATDAGRMVIPSEILGIPAGTPRALYEDAVVNVAGLLSAISSTLANGLVVAQNIQLPPAVCGLTAGIVQLCDVSMSTTVTTPGTGAIVTPGLDTTATLGGDSAFSLGGVAEFRLNLFEPVSGQAFTLPITVRRDGISVNLRSLTCARRGQPLSEARFETRGGTVEVGIASSPGLVVPLSGLGLGIPGLDLVGQNLRVAIRPASVRYGGGSGELCFQGPPWPATRQCDGSLPVVGGASAEDMAAALAGLQSQVALDVEGLPGGTLGDALGSALAPILASLNRIVPAALSGFAGQAQPLLINTGLPVGNALWRVDDLVARSPVVYAR